VSLIIHAPNIHRGGGRTLLLPLLEAAGKRPSLTALLDQRLEIPAELNQTLTITRIVPTIWGRLAGEWTLRRLAQAPDTILCFGNLPPLFRIKGRCLVFLQNRYLVEERNLEGFSLKVKVRLMAERLWLRLFNEHAETFIVQTSSMQQAAMQTLRRPVEIMALFPDFSGYQRQRIEKHRGQTTQYEFLYVATGEPHKNHVNLLEAWKLLASEGLYPSLCVTISELDYPDLFRIVEQTKGDHKLNIYNVPARSSSDMQRLYNHSRALVYPSMMESFGLPLLEASQAGLPIIAAELDYVRDLVDPVEVFDPRSPQSIARAIKRFLQIPEMPVTMLTSDAFISRLFTD
jgi:glycosyltransferase involved in cell wall biosynthesis